MAWRMRAQGYVAHVMLNADQPQRHGLKNVARIGVHGAFGGLGGLGGGGAGGADGGQTPSHMV